MFRKLNYVLGLVAGLLVMLYNTHAHAQTKKSSDTPADSTRLKWEIATDLLWLIDKNQIPASNIFVRKHVTRENGKLGAWRLRVGVSVDDNNNEVSHKANDSTGYDQQTFSITIRSGFEWQKKLDNKFFLFYGIDGQLEGYKNDSDYITIATSPHRIKVNRDDYRVSVGMIGLVGLRYQLNRRVSLSLESNVIFSINKSIQKIDIYSYPDDVFIDWSKYDDKNWNLKFTPISVLNFSYHF